VVSSTESPDDGYANPEAGEVYAAAIFAPIVLGCAKLCPKLKGAPKGVRGVKRKPRPKIPKGRVQAFQPFKNQALNGAVKGKPGASLGQALGGVPFRAAGGRRITSWRGALARRGPPRSSCTGAASTPTPNETGSGCPANTRRRTAPLGANHGAIHTNHYYRNVNMMVAHAHGTGGCKAGEVTLDDIYDMLKNNAMGL
jgi:hypothetical protein